MVLEPLILVSNASCQCSQPAPVNSAFHPVGPDALCCTVSSWTCLFTTAHPPSSAYHAASDGQEKGSGKTQSVALPAPESAVVQPNIAAVHHQF